MAIQLNQPKQITIKEAVIKTITTLTIISLNDQPKNKKVIANIREVGSIVLWQDAAYDAIGQWTDTDVQNRILEMYS